MSGLNKELKMKNITVLFVAAGTSVCTLFFSFFLLIKESGNYGLIQSFSKDQVNDRKQVDELSNKIDFKNNDIFKQLKNVELNLVANGNHATTANKLSAEVDAKIAQLLNEIDLLKKQNVENQKITKDAVLVAKNTKEALTARLKVIEDMVLKNTSPEKK